MYKIDSLNPLIHIYSGEFLNEKGQTWQHRSMNLDQDFELIMLKKGSISLFINGTLFSLQKNDCLLIPPFSKISGADLSDNSFVMDWVHFLAKGSVLKDKDSTFLKGINELVNHIKPNSINHLIVLPTKFKIAQEKYIFQLFRQLISLVNKYRYTDRSKDFMLSLFLTELSNDFLKQQALLHQKNPSSIEYIAEWIRIHLADNPTVTEIAENFELNPTYLSRKFHSEYGISVKTYILEQKLTFAKYLLLTTLLPINEIAEQSFFENPKHFMRTFKQHTDVTPTTYRKLYSNTHMNSKNVDPSSPIPSELGTAALKRVLKNILND